MKIPTDIANAITAGKDLGFTCAGGTVAGPFPPPWGGSGAYPPPGFLPWNILEVGNGDVYGYYWPIGREHADPLVATTVHDDFELRPVASTLQACVRYLALTRSAHPVELREAAEDFAVPVDDLPLPEDEDEDDEDDEEEEDDESVSAADLLAHDPASPYLRVQAAREAVRRRDLDTAEAHLKKAIDRLPEYTEAWSLLAQVRRQREDIAGSAAALLEAVTCPLCFGGRDRRKLLGALQRLRDNAVAAPAPDDPFWRRRGDLTFADGVETKPDYPVLDGIIDAYHRAGQGIRAVRLRVVMGELMARETLPFLQRNGLTWGLYRGLLRDDIERAGLAARLAAVPSDG